MTQVVIMYKRLCFDKWMQNVLLKVHRVASEHMLLIMDTFPTEGEWNPALGALRAWVSKAGRCSLINLKDISQTSLISVLWCVIKLTELIQKPGKCLPVSKHMDLSQKFLDSPIGALPFTWKIQQHFLCVTRSAFRWIFRTQCKWGTFPYTAYFLLTRVGKQQKFFWGFASLGLLSVP